MSALTPPQSTACSPNRSVSVSSAKVVSMTPARVTPSALAYDKVVGDAAHRETGGARLLARPARGRQADLHADAAVVQVERMRVALRAVSNHAHFFRTNDREVSILVVIHRRHL